MKPTSATIAWLHLIAEVLTGERVVPRGKPTLELQHKTLTLDMNRPVVVVPARKLNYKFMAAEAYWMLTGDDSTAGIVPWNKHIAEFSDDGLKFFGAYGPKIVSQLEHVVRSLVRDPETRQAVINIWRENPPRTKDVPCTTTMAFAIRGGRLNAHVFMRSNDVWLGTPYDVFNFSMVAHLVCARINSGVTHRELGFAMTPAYVEPGTLYLTAMSSHLYETNIEDVRRVFEETSKFNTNLADLEEVDAQRSTPRAMHRDPEFLIGMLGAMRDTSPGDAMRWWEAR